MTKSRNIGRGGARKGAGRKRVQPTDLQRFVALYKSFGIECVVNKEHELSNAFITFVESNPHQDNQLETISDCFQSDIIETSAGDLFASCDIWFDENGKFLHQDFVIP
jgi:hypothetical protein